MEELWPVLIIVVVAAVWWAVAKPQAVFVVRIRDGKLTIGRGKVTEAFSTAVTEVFEEFGLQSGEIRGVSQGRRIALWFSSGIPAAACQRLRNWWAMSGWSAKPNCCR